VLPNLGVQSAHPTKERALAVADAEPGELRSPRVSFAAPEKDRGPTWGEVNLGVPSHVLRVEAALAVELQREGLRLDPEEEVARDDDEPAEEQMSLGEAPLHELAKLRAGDGCSRTRNMPATEAAMQSAGQFTRRGPAAKEA
jgi:hypothetical protein